MQGGSRSLIYPPSNLPNLLEGKAISKSHFLPLIVFVNPKKSSGLRVSACPVCLHGKLLSAYHVWSTGAGKSYTVEGPSVITSS
jgi:hypothetical protein